MKYRIERKGKGKVAITDIHKRGSALLADALLNKGTAFTDEERDALHREQQQILTELRDIKQRLERLS